MNMHMGFIITTFVNPTIVSVSCTLEEHTVTIVTTTAATIVTTTSATIVTTTTATIVTSVTRMLELTDSVFVTFYYFKSNRHYNAY